MGACLATEAAAAAWSPGTHGTTYGGNPLAMAVGNAVLDVVLADGFLDGVQRKGLLLKQKLAGWSTAIPMSLRSPRQGPDARPEVRRRLSTMWPPPRSGHSCGPAGDNVVRIMPPLTITEDESRWRSPGSRPPPMLSEAN
jgi:acetylornithine/N-succinyldiaminopimelate aminotransferase